MPKAMQTSNISATARKANRSGTTVTGLVLTLNGERLLDQCLASLDFCDELLVVDSLSSDRTVEIARAHDARVIERAWPGPVDQFRHALENIHTEWVVSLDQDEYLDETLRQEILNALRRSEPPQDLAGYWVNRRSFYFNRFMKHSGWYPDRLLRVFRTDRMHVSASGAHYRFSPQGPTSRLHGDIVHYPYRNFAEHMDKMNSYAQQGADALRAKGRKGGVARALGHAGTRFLKLYLLKLGVFDGRAGFINACAGAYYAFQKYIRIEEDGHWEP
jgi:glycosyltransferase involved in cell wall biosynthesis